MREHTPGPWQAEEASVRGITQEWFVRVDGDDIAIASDIRDRNGNHSEANARLIAAAPELLEALEDLASLAEAAMREVGEYDIEAELADARAAIAKATGDDDAAPECTCAAKDMTFGRCCKVTPNAAPSAAAQRSAGRRG